MYYLDYKKNEIFAMFFGAMLGDGWISQNVRKVNDGKYAYTHIQAGFSGDIEDLETLRNDVNSIIDSNKIVSKILSRKTYSKKYNIAGITNSISLPVSLAKILIQNGMPTGRRVQKEFLMPSWIINGTKKNKTIIYCWLVCC